MTLPSLVFTLFRGGTGFVADGADALIATVAPKEYEGRGLPVLDLDR
ncbi:hypothetical protein [Streptomyces mutabilis]|jgi:hypothetical protein